MIKKKVFQFISATLMACVITLIVSCGEKDTSLQDGITGAQKVLCGLGLNAVKYEDKKKTFEDCCTGEAFLDPIQRSKFEPMCVDYCKSGFFEKMDCAFNNPTYAFIASLKNTFEKMAFIMNNKEQIYCTLGLEKMNETGEMPFDVYQTCCVDFFNHDRSLMTSSEKTEYDKLKTTMTSGCEKFCNKSVESRVLCSESSGHLKHIYNNTINPDNPLGKDSAAYTRTSDISFGVYCPKEQYVNPNLPWSSKINDYCITIKNTLTNKGYLNMFHSDLKRLERKLGSATLQVPDANGVWHQGEDNGFEGINTVDAAFVVSHAGPGEIMAHEKNNMATTEFMQLGNFYVSPTERSGISYNNFGNGLQLAVVYACEFLKYKNPEKHQSLINQFKRGVKMILGSDETMTNETALASRVKAELEQADRKPLFKIWQNLVDEHTDYPVTLASGISKEHCEYRLYRMTFENIKSFVRLRGDDVKHICRLRNTPDGNILKDFMENIDACLKDPRLCVYSPEEVFNVVDAKLSKFYDDLITKNGLKDLADKTTGIVDTGGEVITSAVEDVGDYIADKNPLWKKYQVTVPPKFKLKNKNNDCQINRFGVMACKK